jgi:hypothetical protein
VASRKDFKLKKRRQEEDKIEKKEGETKRGVKKVGGRQKAKNLGK